MDRICQFMEYGVLLLYAILHNLIKKKIKIGKINIMPVIVFICIMVIVSIVEYIGSVFLEKAFNMQLWDYSTDTLNLNGRISLRNSACLSIGAMLMLYFVWPMLEKLHEIINSKLSKAIAVLIVLVVGIDLAITICSKMN